MIVSLNNGDVPVSSYGSTEHLGLGYLAAVLRNEGYSVKIIDAYSTNLALSEVIKETTAFSPQLIGVTTEYNTFEAAVEYCSQVKKINKDITICMGGEHATFASKKILSDQFDIDFIIRGEGEITIVEVADRLSKGKGIEGIHGIYYRNKNGEIIKSIDRSAINNLDSLPFPARDTLEVCLKIGIQPAINILTSRGCHGNCNFCNASKFFNIGGGKPWRSRTPENVVAELKYLLSKYDTSKMYPLIYFADENFIGPGKYGIDRAREIAQRIIEENLNIAFEIFCRADSFDGEEDIVRLLKQAGLTSVLVGLESAKQKGLDIISKKTTVQQNLSTLQLFKKYNIITSSSGFLMFNPYSEISDLIDNANFLLEIGQATIYNMSLKVLLYPGIRITDKILTEGLSESDFLHYRVDRYRFVNPKVKKVAEAINSLDIGVIKREDATLRHLDLTIARIRDLIIKNSKNQKSIEKINKMLQPTLGVISELNAISHRFFIQTVSLTNNSWDESKFNELKEKYIHANQKKIDSLNLTFQEFLDRVEAIA